MKKNRRDKGKDQEQTDKEEIRLRFKQTKKIDIVTDKENISCMLKQTTKQIKKRGEIKKIDCNGDRQTDRPLQ